MNKTKRFFRDVALLLCWQWKQIHWPTLFVWVGGAVAATIIYVLLAIGIAAMCSSCGTKKELHQHTSHVVEADTLAKEAKHDGHVSQTTVNLDSIVTASVWAAMQEFVKSEQEHEVTTETLTETIDSLGRIIRQQQKTTDRTVSRQELQRQQEQLQQLSIDLQRHIAVLDSSWADRMQTFESHLRDSLANAIDKYTETNAAPAATWWQKTWAWLKGIIVGVIICGAIFLFLRFKKKLPLLLFLTLLLTSCYECPRCDATHRPTDNYCPHCGQQLRIVSASDSIDIHKD